MVQRSTFDWLMDGDPAIRWQVLRDLSNASKADIDQARSEVDSAGLGAEILRRQRPDGSWGGAAWTRGWGSTMHALTLLRELGLDPQSTPARNAVDQVAAMVRWIGWDEHGDWHGLDYVGAPFFHGEVEPCINGQVAASGAYFGRNVDRIVDKLLQEQLEDGGWNCDAEWGSIRSSFHTTICVLEALHEYEESGGKRAGDTSEARRRAHDYLMDRAMFKRLATGARINVSWSEFAFPNWWRYDILRGLGYLRRAGVNPDNRLAAAIDILESKRQRGGVWLLDRLHKGTMLVPWPKVPGEQSRWIKPAELSEPVEG